MTVHGATAALTEAERSVIVAIRDGAEDSTEIREYAGLSALTWALAIERLEVIGLIRRSANGFYPSSDRTYELTRRGWKHLAQSEPWPVPHVRARFTLKYTSQADGAVRWMALIAMLMVVIAVTFMIGEAIAGWLAPRIQLPSMGR